MIRLTSLVIAGLEQVGSLAARLMGVRRRWVETSSGKVNLLEFEGKGDLPPILLFHGLASCAQDYVPIFSRLGKRARRLIALDLPGHGSSPVPENGMDPDTLESAVLEVLDQVLEEPVIVVGNSMGGLAAVRYAQARPEKVLGLVLASPAGAPMTDTELSEILDLFRVRSLAKARAFVDRFSAKPNWFVRHFVSWGIHYRANRKGVLDLVPKIDQMLLLAPSDLQALTMPSLVFWGAEDEILPIHLSEFFGENLPDATVEISEGFGHAPFFDRPGAFARRVCDFARQVAER